MKRRLIKKIVKKYGDSWWKVVNETPGSVCYALIPPKKWRFKRMLDEFHKQRRTNGIYLYEISIH